jgi:hypothetical protein
LTEWLYYSVSRYLKSTIENHTCTGKFNEKGFPSYIVQHSLKENQTLVYNSAFQISRNRIVQSFSQQGDTQNDMKIETLAEGRNIERRKKETNLSRAFTFVDNKWKIVQHSLKGNQTLLYKCYTVTFSCHLFKYYLIIE